MTGSLLALLAVALAFAGAACGLAYAFWQTSKQPPKELDVALASLRAERARDKAELSELAEFMTDTGERVSRARARIETANQRAEQKEKRAEPVDEEAQFQASLSPLDQVKLRARRMGKL